MESIVTGPRGSDGVLVARSQADRMLRAYGAIIGMAAGSALGAPWSLVTPPRSGDPIDMRGRPGAEAGQWTEAIAPAICLLEAFGSASGAVTDSSESEPDADPDSLDRASGMDLEAAAEDYARRLLAWYRQDPVDVPSALQLVLNDAQQPDPYLLRRETAAREATSGQQGTGERSPGHDGQGQAVPGHDGHGQQTDDQQPEHQQERGSAGVARRLRDAARARWEATRLGHRFADNHALPLAVVCGVAFAGVPAAAANSAAQMSIMTTVHPLSVGACQWLAAVIASCVGKADAGEQSGFDPLAALEQVGLELEVEPSLRDAILSAQGPESGGAGLDALAAVSRVVGAIRHAGAQYARRKDLNPMQVAVEDAVRAGGDTEMVAALVGAVAGAVAGVSKIPGHWVEALHGWPGMGADGLRDLVAAAVGR